MEYGENPYILTGLDNVKRLLGKALTETDDDALLMNFISTASNRIEQYLNRNVRARAITEYQDGKGLNSIYVKNPPIDSGATFAIYDDTDRSFGASTLIDSDTYSLNYENGIIKLDSGVFVNGNQNIKIVYTGGFSRFTVVLNSNDIIEWHDGTTTQYVTLTAGSYTAASLASHAQTQMQVVDATITVVYNEQTGKFKFNKTSGTFIPKWFNGTYQSRTAGYLFGMDPSINQSSINVLNWGTWDYDTGTVGITPTTVTFSSRTGQIKVENTTQADHNLYVSFDGGTTYYTIIALLGPYEFPFGCTSCKIYGDVAATYYEISYTVESGALTWNSDVQVLGIPHIIQKVCMELVNLYWFFAGKTKMMPLGYNTLSKEGVAISIDWEAEERILKTLNQYKISII